MNHRTVKNLICLAFFSLFTLNIFAQDSTGGLSEYLKNPNVPTNGTIPALPASPIPASTEVSTTENLTALPKDNLTNGDLSELRMEAEENTEQIHTVATAILQQGKETTQITQNLRDHAETLEIQQQQTEKFSKEMAETTAHVKQQEQEIDEVTTEVKNNMGKIQKYWDTQVNDTVNMINLFQHKLSDNINIANEGLERMDEQKELSTELLQEFLEKHNKQSALIDNHSEMSDKVSANLALAYDESKKLISLLRNQQEKAEQTLGDYSQRLKNFEEQAYEQFDTSFQVADLARQELSANIEENRKHIETMRRQEEQSHGLNNQIAKNLESLDYSKIVKISHTLDNTQNMFEDIHLKVDETRDMLGELKELEEEIKLTANNVKHVTNESVKLQEEPEINQENTDTQRKHNRCNY